jgi:hypothetical protein
LAEEDIYQGAKLKMMMGLGLISEQEFEAAQAEMKKKKAQ